MSGQMQVQCPKCATKLGLTDDSLFGRKVACASCGTAFVIADNRPDASQSAPVKEPDEFEKAFGAVPDEFRDEFVDYESARPKRRRPRDDFDDDFEEYPPRRRRRRSKPAKKDIDRPPAWIKPTAIVCVSLLAVVCVAGGIFLAVKSWGGGTEDVENTVAYLADESDGIVVVRLDKMRENNTFRTYFDRNTNRKQLKSVLDTGGLDSIDDLDLVVVGVRGSFETRQIPVFAVRAKKSWNRSRIERVSDVYRHNGRKYFMDKKSSQFGTKMAGFFPDSRTIVVGEESAIKRMLDNDSPKPISESRFGFVDFSQDMVVAFAPKSGHAVPDSMRRELDDSPFSPLGNMNIKGVSFGGVVGSDSFDVKLQAECDNMEDAAKLVERVNEQLNHNRDFAADFLRGAPNGDALADGLSKLQVSSEGSTVVATTSLPATALEPFSNNGFNGFPFGGGGFKRAPRAQNNPGFNMPGFDNFPKPEFPDPHKPQFRPPQVRIPKFRPPTVPRAPTFRQPTVPRMRTIPRRTIPRRTVPRMRTRPGFRR